MPELGHVVFYVRDLEKSLAFYRDLVGLELKGRIFANRGALMSGGRTHHELLLLEVGEAPGPLRGKRIGLYHVAWKPGDNLEGLRIALKRIESQGVTRKRMADHSVSRSIYVEDPDGNEVELYTDNPEFDWRNDSSWMEAPVKPLTL